MKNIDQQIEQTRRTVAQNPESLELKASFLRLRMQAGQIEPETIKYCSSLGDPICRMFFPKQPEMGVEQVLGEINEKMFNVEFAIYCAEKVLPIFEEQYPADDRPRLAIEAAKSWLKDPSEENRRAAYTAAVSVAANAAHAASVAAYAAAYAAYAAADAAAYAAYAAADAAAYAARALGEETTDNQLLIEYLMLGDNID